MGRMDVKIPAISDTFVARMKVIMR